VIYLLAVSSAQAIICTYLSELYSWTANLSTVISAVSTLTWVFNSASVTLASILIRGKVWKLEVMQVGKLLVWLPIYKRGSPTYNNTTWLAKNGGPLFFEGHPRLSNGWMYLLCMHKMDLQPEWKKLIEVTSPQNQMGWK